MRMSAIGNVIVETVDTAVRVMRFERADVSPYLYDDAEIAFSPLYREIWGVALRDLPKEATLIVNLKRLKPFGAAFYRCLLQIRRFLRGRRSRLVLCCLSAEHHELFELFAAYRIFTVVDTELDAMRHAMVKEEESYSLVCT